MQAETFTGSHNARNDSKAFRSYGGRTETAHTPNDKKITFVRSYIELKNLATAFRGPTIKFQNNNVKFPWLFKPAKMSFHISPNLSLYFAKKETDWQTNSRELRIRGNRESAAICWRWKEWFVWVTRHIVLIPFMQHSVLLTTESHWRFFIELNLLRQSILWALSQIAQWISRLKNRLTFTRICLYPRRYVYQYTWSPHKTTNGSDVVHVIHAKPARAILIATQG